jgi:hypothetical protein
VQRISRTSHVLLAAFVLGLPSGALAEPPKSAGPKITVFVLDLDTVNVDAKLGPEVRRLIAQTLHDHGEYAVLTPDDVKDLFSLEQSKQVMGCQSEASCLVERTKAVNADLTIKGSIGVVGKITTIALSLIDNKKVSVKNRVSASVESDTKLGEAAKNAVRDLFAWTGAETKVAFKLPSGKKTSFAVFDLVATGVAPEIATNLTQILSVEIKRVEGASVIGRDDIKAMLAMEQQKQLVGCSDESCLAEIGAALGVSYLIVGHVGKVAETYVVSLRLIVPDQLRVENRVTESFYGREDQLVGAVRAAARKLVGIVSTQKGTLSIGANEEDSEAFVDGASVGKIPMRPVENLAEGRHTVRIARSGFFDWSTDAYVEPGGATVLWAELEKKPTAFYESWLFWTGTVGVVAAGAVVAGLLIANQSNKTYPFNLEVGLPQR